MKMELDRYVFLLGGHDLEMVEIRKLLLAEGYSLIDKNLEWGARRQDYDHEIKNLDNDGKTFIDIELSNKDNMSKDAIYIDHHNEWSGDPASIEWISNQHTKMPIQNLPKSTILHKQATNFYFNKYFLY
jgi:hypothetical protein